MSNQTIFIVDDEEAVQITAGALLKTHDFLVVQARSLKEARDVFEIHKDILSGILMDGRLDTEETFELVKEIRKSGFQKPIIAFSGHEGSQLKLMTAGCSHRIDNKGNNGDFMEKIKEAFINSQNQSNEERSI